VPEIYIHERIALCAARQLAPEQADLIAREQAAYRMGASGPDIMFFHCVWQGGNKYALPKLGSRMHTSRTNAFLYALLINASTPAQIAYAWGFLCHYAADSILHAYVYAMSEPDGLFPQSAGHGLLEMAMDSWAYVIDHPDSKRIEPDFTLGPFQLNKKQEAEIASLLSICVQQIYNLACPAKEYQRAFAHARLVKRVLYRPGKARMGFFRWLEKLIGHPGLIEGHAYPARLPECDFLNEGHNPWQAPDDDRIRTDSVPDLCARAECYAGELLRLCQAGPPERTHLFEALGQRSYVSDLPGSSEGEGPGVISQR